jgi:hypothetical protein
MMRFVAPPRAEVAVDAELWRRPPLADFVVDYPWLRGRDWPSLAQLNQQLAGRAHPQTGRALQFVAQTPQLLRDGLHYEQRSFQCGEISTRLENWHDLLNAAIWLRHTALKAAVNARYVAELPLAPLPERSRAQMALTHFDEGGVIVLLRDAQLLVAWDAHDWPALFFDHAEAWRQGRIEVIVFGHALLEHALRPSSLLVGKALALLLPARATAGADAGADRLAAVADIAAAISAGRVLNDPQELRPLPLSGIPGWHAASTDRDFYRSAACFRPRRAGRTYPPPLVAAGAPIGEPVVVQDFL